jgi:hypothetical protein
MSVEMALKLGSFRRIATCYWAVAQTEPSLSRQRGIPKNLLPHRYRGTLAPLYEAKLVVQAISARSNLPAALPT